MVEYQTDMRKIDIIQKDRKLGLHLSRNQYEHVYKESPEEGLVQKYRLEAVKGEKHRWRNIKALALSKGNAAKQNDIM